jgi:hypothetical protein
MKISNITSVGKEDKYTLKGTIHGEVGVVDRNSQNDICCGFLKPNDSREDILIDPITLEEIGSNKITFSAPNGKEINYNVQSIYQYFIKSGNLIDPVTRVEWCDEDIRKLESLMIVQQPYSNLNLKSLIKTKKNETEVMKSNKQNVLSLERCIGEIVSEILKIIEGKSSSENSDLNLMLLLSQIEIPFEEMKANDIEYSYHVWSSWLTFIHGPRIKPTISKGNFLNTADEFIKSMYI